MHEEQNKGHKVIISIRVNERRPMRKEAFQMFGHKQRSFISKHPFTYHCVYTDSKFDPMILATDDSIGKWFCMRFSPGIYYLMGYSIGKTVTKKKLVGLCKIEIEDSENNKFKITKQIGKKKINRLDRMWMRKK